MGLLNDAARMGYNRRYCARLKRRMSDKSLEAIRMRLCLPGQRRVRHAEGGGAEWLAGRACVRAGSSVGI